MTWETEDQLHDLGQATATLNLSFHAHSKGLIKPGAWCLLLRSHCSCAQLWTAARQATLSMGVSRQEYWSGKLFPPPGDLPNAGIKPRSPASQADSSPLGHRSSPETGGRPLEPHLPSALRLRWSRARALFLSLSCHQARGLRPHPQPCCVRVWA